MSLLSAVFLYLLIWWLVLFTQLSRGAGRVGEQKVHDTGAPVRPLILTKILWTSVISAIVLFLIWIVTLTGWLSMFEILTGEQL